MEGLVLLWNILELAYSKICAVPNKILLMKEWMHSLYTCESADVYGYLARSTV